jgi:methylase of polypeptide subunit release factors
LEIKKYLQEYFDPGMKFLDMGTGPYGVLSYYVKNKLKGNIICGADHLEELIINAGKQNPANDIMFITSNLFENINSEYDCIAFNAPYIDKTFGKNIGVLKDNLSINRFSGGEGGLKTIVKFIESLTSYLTNRGTCILGVNHYYVKHDKISDIINTNKSLELVKYHKNNFTKSAVYILRRKI